MIESEIINNAFFIIGWFFGVISVLVDFAILRGLSKLDKKYMEHLENKKQEREDENV